MTTAELQNALTAHGVTLEPRGATLRARGPLTPELREAIKEHKAELLSLLEPQTPGASPERKPIPPLPWQLERLVSAAASRLLPTGAVPLPGGFVPDLGRYVLACLAGHCTGAPEAIERLWDAYHAWRPEEVN
jgi:hypothetical protein